LNTSGKEFKLVTHATNQATLTGGVKPY